MICSASVFVLLLIKLAKKRPPSHSAATRPSTRAIMTSTASRKLAAVGQLGVALSNDDELALNRAIGPTIQSKKAKCTPTPERTTSFAAVTAATWPHLMEEETETPLHTLILGTHPSIESLKGSEYYGFPLNAFWWIVGDCLGFHRGTGLSASTGKPYKFAHDLRKEYAQTILSYHDQVSCLVRHGFGLWDIFESCERPGSLNKDIKNALPNQIRELAAANSHLRRIVIANGEGAATKFKQNFSDWCKSSELQANDDEKSQKALGKQLQGTADSAIKVVVAMSPSPAAASVSYTKKRDF